MAQAYINGYQPYPIDDFSGGINLRDKADVVTDKEAVDLLNVTFSERGAMRQRDGYVDLTTADLTNRVDSLGVYYNAAGVKQIVAGAGTRIEVISTAGATVASQTGMTGGPYVFARIGSPGVENLYAANGADVTPRWDGAAWTSGAAIATVNGTAASAMPKAGALAVTATVPGTTSGSNASNRLIATAFGTQTNAGPGGTATNPSRWYASNPGQPEAWETDGTSGRGRNFGDLTPGDGEQIMAAVTWRELVFIFKETKFFVLWGESTAADGTPVFNFREVVNNVGLAAKQAVCVGRDGVYFMSRRGVYLTNGGDPRLLSDKVRPIWTGDPDVYYQSGVLNHAQIALTRMEWTDEQLFVAIPTGTATANDRVLVYDTQHDWWSLYDLKASALRAFRRGDRDELHFGYSTANKRVGHLNQGTVTDPGPATIVSRLRSGWSDYGQPVQKTFRETKVWGSGAVQVAFSTDFNVAQTSSQTAFFGVTTTWPNSGTWQDWITANGGVWPGGGQVSSALVRKAVRGTVFSTQFMNAPGSPTWSVHRLARHLRETREASIR